MQKKSRCLILVYLLLICLSQVHSDVVFPGTIDNTLKLSMTNSGSFMIPDLEVSIVSEPTNLIDNLNPSITYQPVNLMPNQTTTWEYKFDCEDNACERGYVELELEASSGDVWSQIFEIDCRMFNEIEVVYVMDESNSMLENENGAPASQFSYNKWFAAKKAAQPLFSQVRPKDKIGVIGFADAQYATDATQVHMYMRNIDEPSSWPDDDLPYYYITYLQTIAELGQADLLLDATNFEPAIAKAYLMMENVTTDHESQNILLFTDGEQAATNGGGDLSGVQAQLNQIGDTRVSVIGVGNDCDVSTCSMMARATGGRYRHSGLNNFSQVVLNMYRFMTQQTGFGDFAIESANSENVFDIYIPEDCGQITITLDNRFLMTDPEDGVDGVNFGYLELLKPNGIVIQGNINSYDELNSTEISYANETNVIIINKPIPGLWEITGHPTSNIDNSSQTFIPYTITVSGYSDLSIQTEFDRNELLIGEPALLTVAVSNQEEACLGLSVNADVVIQTMDAETIALYDNGSNGDEIANDGIYSTYYTLSTNLFEGLYAGDIVPNVDFKVEAQNPSENISIVETISIPIRDVYNLDVNTVVLNGEILNINIPVHLGTVYWSPTTPVTIRVKSGGTLNIWNDVYMYGNMVGHKIVVEEGGHLILGNNIKFLSYDDGNWTGLEIYSSDALTFVNPIFENCDLYSELAPITLDGGSFINSDIKIYEGNLALSNTELNNSTIFSKVAPITIANGIFTDSSIDANVGDLSITSTNFTESNITYRGDGALSTNANSVNCSLLGSTFNNTASIPLKVYSALNYEILDNTFDSGIYNAVEIFESGWGKFDVFENNVITSAADGLTIYASRVDIISANKFNNCSFRGLIGFDKSEIILSGNSNFSGDTQSFNNCFEGILATHNSFPVLARYNKFLSITDNHIACIDHDTSRHRVTNNFFDKSLDESIDLFPSSVYFDITSTWDGNNRDGEITDPDEILFMDAMDKFENENYQTAKQLFQNLINYYPNSEFAQESVKELFAVEQFTTNNYTSLQQTLLNDSIYLSNSELTRVAVFFANKCNLKLENYPAAILHYESIIDNPETIQDSIFAVIDAGYAYMLMGSDRKAIGRYSWLCPESEKDFEDTKKELLNTLLGETENQDENDNSMQIPNVPVIHNNYPNPFNPTTTIKFSVPKESEVEILVYNVKGQKVKKLASSTFERGQHQVIWNGRDDNHDKVSSGIYFYKYTVNGKVKSNKKMLLLK